MLSACSAAGGGGQAAPYHHSRTTQDTGHAESGIPGALEAKDQTGSAGRRGSTSRKRTSPPSEKRPPLLGLGVMPGTRTVSGENLSKRGLCGGLHENIPPPPRAFPSGGTHNCKLEEAAELSRAALLSVWQGTADQARGTKARPASVPPPRGNIPPRSLVLGHVPRGAGKEKGLWLPAGSSPGVGTSADPQPTEEQENPDATPFSVPSHQECCLVLLSQGFLESWMACNFLYSRDWP